MKRTRGTKKVTTIEGLAHLMVGEFARMDDRLDRIEVHMSGMAEEIRAIRSDIAYIFKRLDALEDAVGHIRGYAKEIDDLRAHVRTLEARLAKCEAR